MLDEQDEQIDNLEINFDEEDAPLTSEQQMQELMGIADALRTLPSQMELDIIAGETEQVAAYIKGSTPSIVVPRKAIPTDQERIAEIKKIIESKTFIPLNKGIKERLKPWAGESFDDYINRCVDAKHTQNKEEIADAVMKISELSRALLKEVEEGRVFHVSERKTIKQQFFHYMEKAKIDLLLKKDELFWKIVDFMKKHLKVVRSYE
jgi:hypothetical protein